MLIYPRKTIANAGPATLAPLASQCPSLEGAARRHASAFPSETEPGLLFGGCRSGVGLKGTPKGKQPIFGVPQPSPGKTTLDPRDRSKSKLAKQALQAQCWIRSRHGKIAFSQVTRLLVASMPAKLHAGISPQGYTTFFWGGGISITVHQAALHFAALARPQAKQQTCSRLR